MVYFKCDLLVLYWWAFYTIFFVVGDHDGFSTEKYYDHNDSFFIYRELRMLYVEIPYLYRIYFVESRICASSWCRLELLFCVKELPVSTHDKITVTQTRRVNNIAGLSWQWVNLCYIRLTGYILKIFFTLIFTTGLSKSKQLIPYLNWMMYIKDYINKEENVVHSC